MRLADFNGAWLRSSFGEVLSRRLVDQKRKIKNSLFDLLFNNQLPVRHPLRETYKNKSGGIPRAYVLKHSPVSGVLNRGETYSFQLTLLGHFNQYLPEICAALANMCEAGLGENRARCRLLSILEEDASGQRHFLWHHSDKHILQAGHPISIHDFRHWQFRDEHLTFRFLSPTQIKERDFHPADFSFPDLLVSLFRRMDDLSQIYFNEAPAVADTFLELHKLRVTTDALSLRRMPDFLYHSHSQQAPMWIKGYTGTITYKGRFNRYLPMLKLGEFLHIGNKTTYGCGAYTLAHEEATYI
jgi:CRISPR-associated endoribonuclease Cas6